MEAQQNQKNNENYAVRGSKQWNVIVQAKEISNSSMGNDFMWEIIGVINTLISILRNNWFRFNPGTTSGWVIMGITMDTDIITITDMVIGGKLL
jgi:hypothetical protein